MEQFRADLHIHSRYSRATSKGLTPQLLALWARVKGLDVIGTGDFTHPGWIGELEQSLVVDRRSGLYMLADTPRIERVVPWLEGYTLSGRTRFILQTEISSIYKKDGKVRKVHNLVYMPSLEKARDFSRRLAKVGNLESDGRPILGLDSRHLLEMVLETDPLAFLVPAHIWTPWFSLFGSKSGFDSIEECFGDLSKHIFALETGLSSDPEMNWTISALDNYSLISNSDAHSAEKLGREANRFSGEISYEGIYHALRGEALGHKFLGTIEFFPEEGKYHLDGHRKCGVVLEPRETLARGGLCPVCGKPLTLGVLHRVMDLADRETPQQPDKQPGFVSLVPLPELISEIVGTGPGTKKVQAYYAKLMQRFGSEMCVLFEAPLEELQKVSPLLAEGVDRMRKEEVLREPGFDGQYGAVRVFTKRERDEFSKGGLLHGLRMPSPETAERQKEEVAEPHPGTAPPSQASRTPNQEQQTAIQAGPGPVLVVAGPGTGKTHTLINRIAWLVEQGENPRHILAVTFTRRAAQELQDRLLHILAHTRGQNVSLPRADTLHALAFDYWTAAYDEAPTLLSEESAFRAFREANAEQPVSRLRPIWKRIARKRECMASLEPDRDLFHNYTKLKESWNLADFTDLLVFWLEQINNNIYTCPYTHVLVDEVQDFSALQLAVVQALLPKASAEGAGGEGLFAIGDPKQSIYAFRGALAEVREALSQSWPHLQTITLAANYRSPQAVLDAAAALFSGRPDQPRLAGPCGTARHGAALPRAQRRERGLLAGGAHPLVYRRHQPLPCGRRRRRQNLGRSGFARQHESGRYRRSGTVSAPWCVPCNALWSVSACPVPPRKRKRFGTTPASRPFFKRPARFWAYTPGQEAQDISCPDHVLTRGPVAVEAYMQDMPPFDKLFWESRAFRQLVKAFDEHGGWPALLNWVHLQSSVEQAGQRSERIRIMTLHAAKGLEFEAVFLPALEDGILPFAGASFLSGTKANGAEQAAWSPDFDLEEERRLFYVGMTRAKRALYLSHAARRTLFGKELRLQPSRFLQLLPENLLQRSTLKSHTRRTAQQLRLA